jgi:hypothetical protein
MTLTAQLGKQITGNMFIHADGLTNKEMLHKFNYKNQKSNDLTNFLRNSTVTIPCFTGMQLHFNQNPK